MARTHGLSKTQEYRAWQTMRLRCTVPTNQAYPDYGGRGITVCAAWMDSFETFLADMGTKPSPDFELDRIDNDEGYEPGNCRWTTRSENDRNRRSTVWVVYRGERVRLIDLTERFGIRQDTAQWRIDKGWSVEDAVEKPARKKAPNGAGRKVTNA